MSRASSERIGVSSRRLLAICATAMLCWGIGHAQTLCFEAEAAKQLSGKAFKVTAYAGKGANKASEGKVLAIPPAKQGERVSEDTVVYSVNIPKTGTYYLWARTLWTTGCGNSVFVQLDAYKNRRLVLGGDSTYNAMHWITLSDGGDNTGRPLPLSLKKGVLALTLGGKESGVLVDQFLLTTDKEKQPVDIYAPTKGALK